MQWGRADVLIARQYLLPAPLCRSLICAQTGHLIMSKISNLKLKSKLYYYAAIVREVYDGDTLTVDLDLGMRTWRHHQKIRLWRVNTPELRGADRERGLQIRDFVRKLVLNKLILVRTILDKRGQDRSGKFGRLLGEVLIVGEGDEVINLNELLLAKGYAVPMAADGSMIASALAPSRGGYPPQIACPFCGETRMVDVTTGAVEICPNCLDDSLRTLATGG